MTLEELKNIIVNSDKDFIEIKGENFKNENIVNLNFTVFFENCNFKSCIFEKNLVDVIKIKNCAFEKCKFKKLKYEDTYVETYKAMFRECEFYEIDLITSHQTSIHNIFENCNFENIKLDFNPVESYIKYNNCTMNNCDIIINESTFEWKDCELKKCFIGGYFMESKFENIKMTDTEIVGNFQNNKCINCTLDGKEFILEDNIDY